MPDAQKCRCGCKELVKVGSQFISGHDKRAESDLIKNAYGTVVGFLDAHEQYRTDVAVYDGEGARFRITCPALDLFLEGDDLFDGLKRMQAVIQSDLARRDNRGEKIHPVTYL